MQACIVLSTSNIGRSVGRSVSLFVCPSERGCSFAALLTVYLMNSSDDLVDHPLVFFSPFSPRCPHTL